MTLRYLSVCSGIEAASAAWHVLGWHPVAFAEIEAFPSAVLAHHYPHVPNWGDMTRFQEWPDADVDVLVGGTPCQSFSVAGLRAGLNDPRGNLMLTFAAVARRYRPDWVVWENVPGVLSSERGRDFASFVELMGECGYFGAWRVLDAQYFGVAQRRRRPFFVGHARNWRRAAAVLLERESMRGNPAPRRETRAGTAVGALGGTSPGGGWRVGADEAAAGQLVASTGELAHCLNAGGMGRQDYETETLVAHALRADGFDASEDGTGRGTPIIACAAVADSLTVGANQTTGFVGDVVAFAQNQREELREPHAAGALSSIRRGDAKNETLIAFSCKDHGADAGSVSPTLRSMNEGDGNANAGGQVAVAFNWQGGGKQTTLGANTLGANTLGANTTQAIAHAMSVRRLTPRECERLQGFPDDYTLIPYRGKPAADGPRYKALGNSMAVPVMRWIGERIAAVHAATQRKELAA